MEQQPWLRPPTQDYINKFCCRTKQTTSTSASSAMKERAASRLFEAMANEPEPTDLAKFYKGVTTSATVARDALQASRRRIALLLLCCAQAVCSLLVAASYGHGPHGGSVDDKMLQVTLLLICVSGIIGLFGAWRCAQHSFIRLPVPSPSPHPLLPTPPLPPTLSAGAHLYSDVQAKDSSFGQVGERGAVTLLCHSDMVALDAIFTVPCAPTGMTRA